MANQNLVTQNILNNTDSFIDIYELKLFLF